MLRMVFNVTWRDRVRNEVLYGDLPRITTQIRKRRHCVRHPELAASNLVLWEPTQGRASRGGQSLTFIDQLLRNTSLKTAADIRTCMEDRDVWHVIVARGDSTRCDELATHHKESVVFGTAIMPCSYDARPTTHVLRHPSHDTRPTTPVPRYTSYDTRLTTHIPRHASHDTRPMIHVLRHPSHDTRQTTHVI